MNEIRHSELIASAWEYLRRGWQPIPIPAGQKGPVLKEWQHLRLTARQIPRAFTLAGNLGLLLGEPSHGLVDVDLDCEEARQMADKYLPPTEAITGRPSSPRSHRWYSSPGLATTQHRDPITRASLVELRSTGGQTLVGPSIHPTGEPYDRLIGELAIVKPADLQQAVHNLAQAIIRLRYGDLPPPSTGNPKDPNHPPSPGHRKPRPRRALPPSLHLPQACPHHESHPSQDMDHLLRRASAYLGKLPPAIAGQNGHTTTFRAAIILVRRFGLPPDAALHLLLTEYNPRCDPPWSERELRHKVEDALTIA